MFHLSLIFSLIFYILLILLFYFKIIFLFISNFFYIHLFFLFHFSFPYNYSKLAYFVTFFYCPPPINFVFLKFFSLLNSSFFNQSRFQSTKLNSNPNILQSPSSILSYPLLFYLNFYHFLTLISSFHQIFS